MGACVFSTSSEKIVNILVLSHGLTVEHERRDAVEQTIDVDQTARIANCNLEFFFALHLVAAAAVAADVQ